MIFDCFTFYNELDVLEIRLTLLEGIVDRFVLCEAPFTFRGKPKPLWYAENASRFARWHDKIVHLVYPAQASDNPWLNEWGQRAFLTNALRGSPDDLVLIGDVDEIPHPRNAARSAAPGRILGHRQRYAVGYFNRIIAPGWVGTRAIRLGDIPAYGTLADVRKGAGEELECVDGGWHFSSLGGASVMEEKMHAYSHRELDVPYYTDRRRLEADFRSAKAGFWSPLEDDAPALFRDPRWAAYVWSKPAPDEAAKADDVAHAHGCFAYVPAAATRIAAVTDQIETWSGAGAGRFGAAFAGAATSVEAIAPDLEPGSWIVIDGYERLTARDLAALHGGRLHVVAYARNSRSHDVLYRVLKGAPFPRGRTIGLLELKGRISATGFAIERCDAVSSRWIFAPPDIFPAEGTFERDIPPFRLLSTTREALLAFLSHAFVAVFSAEPGPGLIP
jgi:hypothetical protein